jgi:hypothetical protein
VLMIGTQTGPGKRRLLRTFVSGAGLALLAACGAGDSNGPAEPSTAVPAGTDSLVPPADSAPLPIDSTVTVDTLGGLPTDSSGAIDPSTFASGMAPGIVFGSYGMNPTDLNSIHTGTLRGGGITENNVVSFLTAVRAKGGRMVLKMSMGRDSYVMTNGVFDLNKWKSLVSRFKKANLAPFISDGTLMGHFLIDEPHRSAKWGKVVTQATVEAMAAYSKSIWPNLTTFVRVAPTWLASAPVTYRALDAGWLQYTYGKGQAAQTVAAEISAAKSKGLGLMVGLNILDGGNGSSKVAGWSRGKYAMSATEIRDYGTALLNQSYACGFYNWMYQDMGLNYFNRVDIKSALAALSTKAKAHVRTSCRQ